MERTKWLDRKFNFDFPAGLFLPVLERLHGTEPRLQHIIRGLNENQLSLIKNGKWSVKQHIGHLFDLEDVHTGRIDDFKARKDLLRAADMSNEATNAAAHNETNAGNLIAAFSAKRQLFIQKLLSLSDHEHSYISMHPRLKVTVRPVDIAYFTAEHDDHHIATMRELTNNTSA